MRPKHCIVYLFAIVSEECLSVTIALAAAADWKCIANNKSLALEWRPLGAINSAEAKVYLDSGV